jgi:hypothetical protein
MKKSQSRPWGDRVVESQVSKTARPGAGGGESPRLAPKPGARTWGTRPKRKPLFSFSSAMCAARGITTRYTAPCVFAAGANAVRNAVVTSTREHINRALRPEALEKASTPYCMMGSWRLLLKRLSGPPFLFT